MSKLRLVVDSIDALTPAQKSQLVRTGIIAVENTQAEEDLWQICTVLLDRTYIAKLLGLHITTFNTYINNEYRLALMKEKLFTKLGNDIRQTDIKVVHNMYKKLQAIAEQTND